MIRRTSYGLVLMGLVACGPTVSEMRLAAAPSRGQGCELQFLSENSQVLLAPGSPWELLGQVILQEEGRQDPFSKEYRAIVRSRACDMGGGAVAILTTAVGTGLVISKTAIIYGVLRWRTPQMNQPTTF